MQAKLDNAHRRIRIVTVNLDEMVKKYEDLEARMAKYLKGDEGRAERFKEEREKFLR